MYFLILVIILLVCMYYVLIHPKRKFLNEFPVPPGNFLLGHTFEVRSTTDILNVLSRHTEKYGPTVTFYLGPTITPLFVMMVTCDYKFIEFILSSSKILTKSENYQFMEPWLGSGLLVSDGFKWKQHRKILTPAFHFEILKQFIEIFESVGDVFIDKLNIYRSSPSIDLYPLVTLHTLDSICETAMGTKINAQQGENTTYVRSVKEMCRITVDRIFSLVKVYRWSFLCTRDSYLQNKLLKVLHGFSSEIIEAKKENLKINNLNKEMPSKKMAFLDLLLKYSEDGKLLSYDEIREEVDTFMFEGHDTTAAGICFTLFCLANHPEIQDKVLSEQKELFGDEKNPLVTFQELQNMKYLELVIKEGLRLYPPVPVIGRYTTEDIEFNGHTIPSGTNLMISIYHLHRNHEYFSEPETFNPDRFIDNDRSYPYAYIPFSAGPRNCIGKRFAVLEMKSTISKVIRHFELIPASPKHSLVLAVEAVLKSKNGIKVGLKKRI